ncbi:MAG: hypothetical protein EA417_00745, partial [Gammaproteobacteria bacterium]
MVAACIVPIVLTAMAWSVVAQEPERSGRPQRSGPAPPTLQVTEAMLSRGQQIYNQACVSCHGPDGGGLAIGGVGPEATPPDLGDARHMQSRSDMDIARITQFGGFHMPAFPQIRGDDLVSVVAYVRSLSWDAVRTIDLQTLAQGVVEDFVPVSAELLADPPDEDWLMFRRTYDGWAYSPLDQVNRENVDELRLVWSRAMEPGGQYTTPLIHNGVMYVNNPGDVIQAL